MGQRYYNCSNSANAMYHFIALCGNKLDKLEILDEPKEGEKKQMNYR